MESLEFGYSAGFCSTKVSCAGCQLSCLLALACHWRCFTAGLISLLPTLHPCWFSVINIYSRSCPLCPLPSSLVSPAFPFVLRLPLNYTVERAWKEGEAIDCFCCTLFTLLVQLFSWFCKAGRGERSHRWQNSLDKGLFMDGLLAFSSIGIDYVLQFILTVQRFAVWQAVGLLKWPVKMYSTRGVVKDIALVYRLSRNMSLSQSNWWFYPKTTSMLKCHFTISLTSVASNHVDSFEISVFTGLTFYWENSPHENCHFSMLGAPEAKLVLPPLHRFGGTNLKTWDDKRKTICMAVQE